MTSVAYLWQPGISGNLVTHRFPEGLAVFDARNKSTAYLPDPTGAVFDILLREPDGLGEADILQRLNATTATTTAEQPDAECSSLDAEGLQAILVALEQQQLISASE